MLHGMNYVVLIGTTRLKAIVQMVDQLVDKSMV
jgi:hypothetical protein